MTAYKDFRKGILGDLLGLYEAKVAEQLNEIFNSERVVKTLQTVLATSEEFRKVVGKGIEIAAAGFEYGQRLRDGSIAHSCGRIRERRGTKQIQSVGTSYGVPLAAP